MWQQKVTYKIYIYETSDLIWPGALNPKRQFIG